MENEQANEWFAEWFDSPYYHILYNHRDEEEATFFINNLIRFLTPASGATMLDLACGRGRHAVHLHKQGFVVTAVDLSPSNIEYANAFAAEGLEFMVHDMRNLLSANCFDYVFNLFTSFGYFEHMHENYKSIRNMAAALKPGGKLILDFMNASRISKADCGNEVKAYEGYVFRISRKIDGNRIVKQIQVEHGDSSHLYEERVMLLEKSDFEAFFAEADLRIENIFGSYSLDAFNPDESDRMIFIAAKS